MYCGQGEADFVQCNMVSITRQSVSDSFVNVKRRHLIAVARAGEVTGGDPRPRRETVQFRWRAST